MLGEGVRGLRVLIWADWVLRPIILIISCVTLGKLFNLPTPQLFSSLKWANGIYLSGAQSMLICSAYIFFFYARCCAKTLPFSPGGQKTGLSRTITVQESCCQEAQAPLLFPEQQQ